MKCLGRWSQSCRCVWDEGTAVAFFGFGIGRFGFPYSLHEILINLSIS
jgi:hypothetical protein